MKYRLVLALLFGLLLLLAPARISAQQPLVTDDEVKVDIYKKFSENWERNPQLAYEAAKEYMRRYGKEDDQYTRYLKTWIGAYEEDVRVRRLAAEKADREQQLLGSFTTKEFAKAYGLAKPVLADNPENVRVLIALGYGAVAASTEARNESFNDEAAGYAQKAIQLVEAGKTPETWAPFKSKEDVLASLHYALGYYWLKTKPDDAIMQFIKAAELPSDRKTSPATYYYLGAAYQNGPYKRLSADYTKRFGNQPESPDSKAALEKIDSVMDKIIDAYARAISLASKDPQQQAAKNQWMTRLTELYKFRHENSDAGLNDLIASVLTKPLPQP
jgi:hypothetical protein